MENTSALLFDNSAPKFFLAINGKAVGPLTTQELYDRLSQAQCHFLNFVWCEGWPDWRTIAQIEEFADLLPKKPDKGSLAKIQSKLAERRKVQKTAAPQDNDTVKSWYLHTGGAQFGPFSPTELHHVMDVQNVDGAAFVWKAGWAEWKAVKDVPEFASMMKPSLPMPPTPPSVFAGAGKSEKTKSKRTVKVSDADRRGAPRKPLVARLFVHNNEEVVVAVCRDISIGGMQVLTDHVPGEVGSTLKLNVSPGDAKSVKGFVAEGQIVRVLEDGRGFSFRFTKLSEDARRAITTYIKAGAA